MGRWQVTWIDKPGGAHNPNTRIQRLGGPNWENSEAGVISNINRSVDTYFVSVGAGTTDVVVGYRGLTPYLKTKSDGTPLDNLLSLTNVSRV